MRVGAFLKPNDRLQVLLLPGKTNTRSLGLLNPPPSCGVHSSLKSNLAVRYVLFILFIHYLLLTRDVGARVRSRCRVDTAARTSQWPAPEETDTVSIGLADSSPISLHR